MHIEAASVCLLRWQSVGSAVPVPCVMNQHRLPERILVSLLLLALTVGPSGGPLRSASAVAAAPCETLLPVTDDRAREILARERPFAPTNRDLFLNFANPAWTDVAPLDYPDGPAPSEEETKSALRELLQRRFPCAPNRVVDGIKVFDNPIVRQKVPEPTLRAALAALTGTLGEPAIDFVIYQSPVTLIHFGVYLLDGEGIPTHVAGVYTYSDDTIQILIDRRYRFLPFTALSALLFHESLHAGLDDDEAGLPEEAVASALESLVYMQMLLVDPSIAALPDDLTRFGENHQAVVRLNSGPAGSDRLTLFVPDSERNIDPLAVEPLTEFYAYYLRYNAPDEPDFAERESTGNLLLQTVLVALAEPGAAPPTDPNFDQATLALRGSEPGGAFAGRIDRRGMHSAARCTVCVRQGT